MVRVTRRPAHRALLGLSAAACLATATGVARPAAATQPEQPVHAVVFVDVIPSDKQAGLALLTAYVRQARQDRSLQSIVLIKQADISNHFILEESFASRAAYDRFGREDHVRAFRAALFPHLGSPWDERLGIAVSA